MRFFIPESKLFSARYGLEGWQALRPLRLPVPPSRRPLANSAEYAWRLGDDRREQRANAAS
jgi:hypothetical protein